MTTGNHISLFAGVGMTDLATEAFGFKTVATAEQDEFNRSVLAARFPDAHHFADVRDVTRHHPRLVGRTGVDWSKPLLVSGGFPCQDVSLSGHGAGIAGSRSGLWSEFARVIQEFQPEYVLAENVAALRGRGLDVVLADLARLGYEVRWDCIPAAAVGAPHMRDRMFIAAVRRGTMPVEGERVKSLGHISTLAGARLPRAGAMRCGMVVESLPLATQRQAKAAIGKGEMLLPSPAKAEPGWRNLRIQDRTGRSPEHPNQRFYDADSGRVVQKGVAQIATMFPNLRPASHVLLPTPRRAANEWRTTKNAPSHGKGHGKTLAGEVNDLERAAGRTPAKPSQSAGNLSPRWVEWLMGLPLNWTNPDVDNAALRPHPGWTNEPAPRTEADAPHRRKRLEACGNGLVPQAAAIPLSWMIDN